MCVFLFSTSFMETISHLKNNSSRYHKCKYVIMRKNPLFFSHKNETFNFLDISSKRAQIYFSEILPMRAEFFHADRRTNGRI
jgi:hypothetical protein